MQRLPVFAGHTYRAHEYCQATLFSSLIALPLSYEDPSTFALLFRPSNINPQTVL
jgi:hypothetical protein